MKQNTGFWNKLLLACLLLPLFCLPARADAGPKPSVVIALEGLEGRECWGTLLSAQRSTGPYSASDTLNLSGDPEPGEQAAWEAFFRLGKENEEGLYFLNHVDDCSSGKFSWTYYPPTEFRLALWLPDTQTLLVSGRESRYAFDSCFTLSLEGLALSQGELAGPELVRSYDYAGELLGLVGRVALTVGLEVLAALAFKLRSRRQLTVILGANLVTQGLLNLGLNLYTYFCGELAGMPVIFLTPVYLLLELGVVLVELRVYRRLISGREGAAGGRVTAYTWTANLLSLVVGYLLSFQLPQLF